MEKDKWEEADESNPFIDENVSLGIAYHIRNIYIVNYNYKNEGNGRNESNERNERNESNDSVL